MLMIQSTVPIEKWLFVSSQAGFTSTQTQNAIKSVSKTAPASSEITC